MLRITKALPLRLSKLPHASSARRTLHTSSPLLGAQTTGLIYHTHGEPRNVVKSHTWELPELQNGQALVRMKLASVNPADINVIQGVYPSIPTPRDLPGLTEAARVGGNEGIGEVVELKGDAAGLQVGDLVTFGKAQMGTWSSNLIASAEDLLPVPRHLQDKLTDVMASTLMINPATALCMLQDFEKLNEGDVIIQNAANSAVGQAVVQIAARKLGVETINLIRDRPNFEALRSRFSQWGQGGPGTHVYSYDALADRSSGVKQEIQSLLNGRQVRLGINALCGKDTVNMAKLLGEGAHLVTYGAMSRSPLTLPASLLIFRDLRATGFWMTRWYRQRTRAQRAELVARLAEWYVDGTLVPPDARIIRLGQGTGTESGGEEERKELSEAGEIVSQTMEGQKDTKTFLRFDESP